MNSKFLVIAFSLNLFGCGSQQIKPPAIPETKYSHPEHGVVIIPNEYHKSDRSKCTDKVFALGAEIDGIHVTDPEVLKKYKIDAILFSTRDSEMKARKMLSELKRQPIDMNNLNHDPTKSDEYYAEAGRLDDDINKCMLEKGWSKVN